MIDTKALRSRILDLAIQGKLTEQLPSDGTAEELYQQIQAEKQKLIKAGKRFDMLILPEKRHQYEGYNEYFYWKMVDYFSEHLKGKSEKSIDIKDLKLGNWWRGAQEDI